MQATQDHTIVHALWGAFVLFIGASAAFPISFNTSKAILTAWRLCP